MTKQFQAVTGVKAGYIPEISSLQEVKHTVKRIATIILYYILLAMQKIL